MWEGPQRPDHSLVRPGGRRAVGASLETRQRVSFHQIVATGFS